MEWLYISMVCVGTIFLLINKCNKFVSGGIVFILFLIAVTNDFNADYLEYQNLYNRILLGTDIFTLREEIGFCLFLKGMTSFTSDYSYAIVPLYFFSYSVIWWFCNKYSKQPIFPCLCYAIYPYFYDVVQIRNLISFSFVLIAMNCFIKKKIISTNISIVFAALLHVASFSYFLFFFESIIRKNKKFLIVLFPVFIFIIFNYSGYVYERILPYLSTSINFGWIAVYIIYFFMVLMFFLIKNSKLDDESRQLSEYCFKGLLFLSILLPTMFYTIVAERIYRNIMLLLFICLSNYIFLDRHLTTEKILLLLLFIVFQSVVFFSGNYINVMTTIFSNNIF